MKYEERWSWITTRFAHSGRYATLSWLGILPVCLEACVLSNFVPLEENVTHHLQLYRQGGITAH